MPRGGRVPPQRRLKTRRLSPLDIRWPCHRCHRETREKNLYVPGDYEDFAMCASCYPVVVKLWQKQAVRADVLDRYYKKLYKLTLEEYGRLFLKQCGCCGICGEPAEDKQLVVDHDHTTGEVRGLLCGTCNSAIGLLKDDPEVIVKAALYLYNLRLPAVENPTPWIRRVV